ncbi:hypothetical protein FDP41_000714 [Naegleria fowleri]|uniref:Uncharacterized protein n=1 Tax=Naegleria fowleri TaxID=5763 RepID=A0A6A5CHN8_NAEFO|nr:uncharacterized protein FDP41_000714 [Naegleria fowleri]KAF0984815.1 hypothetical protein FDP41_000714 [Naegleria fowleri]
MPRNAPTTVDVELNAPPTPSSLTSSTIDPFNAEEDEENKKEIKCKAIFLSIFTIFFMLLIIPQLSLFVYFYLTINSDPRLANDPNALVFKHKNCCTIEDSRVDCVKSLNETFCKFKITFPLMFFDDEANPSDTRECIIYPNTTFRTLIDSNSFSVKSEIFYLYAGATMNGSKVHNVTCFTDRNETFVSVLPFSRLYNSYYMAAIAMGILMSGFCLAIIIGWLVVPFINMKREGPRRRRRS